MGVLGKYSVVSRNIPSPFVKLTFVVSDLIRAPSKLIMYCGSTRLSNYESDIYVHVDEF